MLPRRSSTKSINHTSHRDMPEVVEEVCGPIDGLGQIVILLVNRASFLLFQALQPRMINFHHSSWKTKGLHYIKKPDDFSREILFDVRPPPDGLPRRRNITTPPNGMESGLHFSPTPCARRVHLHTPPSNIPTLGKPFLSQPLHEKANFWWDLEPPHV